MMRRFQLDRVTGISFLVLLVVAFVIVRVLTGSAQDFTADQKTMVIQGALAALALLTGFWLNGTPTDKPHLPGSTTTTTTTTPGDDGKAPGIKTDTEVKP